MAVYLTKNMLSKMNKMRYGSQSSNDDASSSSSHWQKLFMESNKSGRLAADMICRVCAKAGSTPLSQKLDGCDIRSAICSITNVTIDVDDSLPKFICTECLETLKTALAFKKNCEASDRKFRKIINPMGDPLFHSYPYSKHDFQLILHQMKLKRLKYEEKLQKERMRKERLQQKKEPKIKQFKCSPCDMEFQNKESLVEHRRERQCMRRACDICGQLVLSIAQHMRHMHKESVPHKCPTCGKEFPIIARLKNHICGQLVLSIVQHMCHMHKESVLHKCPTCGKKFPIRACLKNHMLVHTDTFNFFCDLCPYKCKHKYYLVMHMRTHTGEKPYKCPHCPATFVNPSNLNKHKLTHQEKQFKCLLCEKAFRTNTALREHQEATHMNIKHKCVFCGRDFCYKSDLRKHEIKNHNRLKRDYIGGEPTYKQVERLQKLQECTDETDKWRVQQITVTQPVPVACTTYIDQSKEFIQNNHPMYFTDVTGMIQQQPQIVQQQTVQLTLPELELKKYDVKMYEPQQGIGYF